MLGEGKHPQFEEVIFQSPSGFGEQPEGDPDPFGAHLLGYHGEVSGSFLG